MEKFTAITSRVVPVPLKNIDTDMILPAGFMTSVSREGYGQNLFRRLRDQSPDFPFNLDKFKGAEVLAADAFAAFEEAGLFDPALARRFREQVLEIGGSRDIAEAFVAFRGRPAHVDALLRQSGISRV